MRLSVIIAAYNKERTVAAIVDRVRPVPFDIEIVGVDDGSGDRTGLRGGWCRTDHADDLAAHTS